MEIENVFEIGAPPDRVYAFLLDVEHIVGCVPGAELVETIDENTFKGRVRIKVGPITVSYTGNAEITDRNAEAHTAVLKASGRETTGSGSARATANMSVDPKDGGSEVKFVTDFAVAGRVANFGRGVMEDVSRRLVGQMATCIKEHLESNPGETAQEPASNPPPPTTAAAGEPAPTDVGAPAETPAAEAMAAESAAAPPQGGDTPHEAAVPPAAPMGGAAAPATTGEAVTGEPGSTEAEPVTETPAAQAATPPPATSPASPPRPVGGEAKPINAFSLFFSILAERIKRLFGGGRS